MDNITINIKANASRLFEALANLGKAEEVQDEPKEPVSAVVFKQKDGDYRMLGLASNNFEDREEEMFPKDGHQEYSNWIKETGFKPALTIFHLPMFPPALWKMIYSLFGDHTKIYQKIVDIVYKDFAIGQVDHITEVNGFLLISAKIFDHAKGIVDRLVDMDIDLGMSHAFILLEKSGNILSGYRSHEFTVLPVTRAANYFTLPMFKRGKENMKLTQEDKDFINGAYGDGVAENIEELTSDAKDRLESIFDFKSFFSADDEEEESESKESDETAEDEETENKEAEETEEEKVENKQDMEDEEEEDEEDTEDKSSQEDLAKFLIQALDLPTLAGMMKQLGEEVVALQQEVADLKSKLGEVENNTKDLQKSEDEKVAEKVRPIFDWGKAAGIHAASESEDTIVDKDKVDEIESKQKTEEGVNEENALDFGFYRFVS